VGKRSGGDDRPARRLRSGCLGRPSGAPARRSARATRRSLRALAWAGAIAIGEGATRRILPRRAKALLVSHSALATAAITAGATVGGRRQGTIPPAAVLLTLGGYPVGRALLGDSPIAASAPRDSLAAELAALGIVVPVAEELVWGGLVEGDLGVAATSLLFAVKHAVIDGRWRRSLGLALFWAGLGMVRRTSPPRALGLHVACNTAAVGLGHAIARDQF
jgi:membrane protease YdiL (CAAX protease family)